MKYPFLAVLLLSGLFSRSQSPIETANKCYEDKNYQCAADNYKKALAEKKYQQKDHALVLYRIGYSQYKLKQHDDAEKMFKEAIAAKADLKKAYWDLASLYFDKSEFENAAEYYGKAIEQYKSEPSSLKTLYYWRGRSYNAVKKYADALTYFKLAISIDSTNGYYNVSAADASYNLGEYTNAARYYQQSIRYGSDDKKIMSYRYYWMGQSYYKMAKYDEALTAYNGAMEYNPENGDASWGIASVYYNQQKWAEAAAQYTKTMNFFRKDTISMVDLYYIRGRCYDGQNDYAKAIADFDAALKLDPADRQSVWQKASILRKQKKIKEAIVLYDKAIELYEGTTGSLDDLYFFRGDCHLLMKDTTKAEADFRESLKHNSNLREPNITMGNISFARKKYFEAKDYYAKSADGFKADSSALSAVYYRKGYSNFILGSTYYYTARSDFEKSIRYDSNNREARRWLADIYYSQSLFSQTEKEMDKCIVLYKNAKDSLPKMYLYRAMARGQQKKYSEALSDYEQSDKLKKITDAGHVRNMGQFAFEVKNYAKTIVLFTRIIPMYKPEEKNELAFAHYARGRAYHEQKDKVKAKADLEKAIEILPTYAEAKKWLETVNKSE